MLISTKKEPTVPVVDEHDMDMSLTPEFDINFPDQCYGRTKCVVFPC